MEQWFNKDTLPIIVIGGVGLGLVLLAMNSHGSSSGGASPASTAFNTAYTQAAFQAQDVAVQQSTQVKLAQISAGNSGLQAVMSFLTSVNNSQAAITQTMLTSNAQLATSQVNAAAAEQIDQLNNANRLAIANVNAGVSYAQIQEQSHASDNALSAAKATANTNLLSSLFNMGAQVAKSASQAYVYG